MLSLTFEEWTHPPDGDGSQGGVLTEGQLHVEQRKSNQRQHQSVRDEERPCKSHLGES